MFHYYGNGKLVAFEVDPQQGKLTPGKIWLPDKEGTWIWQDIDGLGCAASVAQGDDYDYVSGEKVEAAKKLSEAELG